MPRIRYFINGTDCLQLTVNPDAIHSLLSRRFLYLDLNL